MRSGTAAAEAAGPCQAGGGGGDQPAASSELTTAGARRAGFEVLRQRSANRTSRAISPNRDTCRPEGQLLVIAGDGR